MVGADGDHHTGTLAPACCAASCPLRPTVRFPSVIITIRAGS